jgi:purine nucleoside phosphorylase
MADPEPVVGIIGGSGLGAALFGREAEHRIDVDTPFGKPSSALIRADWNGACS